MANAKACALALNIPEYKYVGGISAKTLPVPMYEHIKWWCPRIK